MIPDLKPASVDALLRHLPVGAYARDAGGTYRWVNPTYAAWYATEPERMIGAHLSDFDHPDAVAGFTAADAAVLATGAARAARETYRRPDGSHGHIRGYRLPLDSTCGRLVAGVFHDYTEVTHLQEHQQVQQALHHAVWGRSSLALALVDQHGTITDASTGLLQDLRTTRGELTGRPVAALLAPRAEAAFREEWQRHRVPPHPTRSLTTWFHAPDGPRPARLTLIPVRREPCWLTLLLVHPSAVAAPTEWSAAETRMLELLAEGASNAAIATTLGLSRQGVDYYLRGLRRRLKAPSRAAVISRAYHLGLLDPGTWPPRATAALT